MMKKRLLAGMLVAAVLFSAVGCGDQAELPKETEETLSAVIEEMPPEDSTDTGETEAATEPEEEAPDGMARNKLTGEWIDEALASERPLGVMIENTAASQPHYGISNADIVYEAPVEGKVTRYMALFQDYSGMNRIGNVRSARTYYAAWAKEYDALFAHYGQSLFANPILATMDDMNALDVYLGEGAIQMPALDSVMFFRASDKESPHNAYTYSEGIENAIQKYDYRTGLADGYEEHFRFAKDSPELLPEGQDAVVVSPGYASDKAYFVYDEDTGAYERYAFGKAETDALTGESLRAKNIILQCMDYDYYSGLDPGYDAKNYLDIAYTGSGNGFYVTNGKAIAVTWRKEAENLPTRYYDPEGEEIRVNPGKTWICTILTEDSDKIGIYADEADFSAGG